MDITEISILHHIGLVLSLLWFLSSVGWCHPAVFFLSFIYLFLVNERYTLRLRKRIQFEEWKQANQKRLLSDSESVRWLNHAVEKVWPICMEQIASQQFLLPIIPWFLEKYKPWTAKEAVVQHLYLGKNPPLFTDIRAVRQSVDDDHLVLEIGMNFVSGDDMSAVLAVKLRKRLGFGMWAKMHVTGMHVEGKVLVGIKFLRQWPFLGRIRLSFVQPPYFQMTVKPIFTHGLDVTEIPGIAGWLDKILSVAFEQSLVEPNMLVVDLEKFVSSPTENWFTVDEKHPVAFAKVEIIEGAEMKPSDMNGLSDPYVKGQLGSYRFRTKIQWKTLTPKWSEEFKIPISSWEAPNKLVLEVRDKDRIFDDVLGKCTVNICDFKDGRRHDQWLALQNVKMGRLHLAVTILEGDDAKLADRNEHVMSEETSKGEAVSEDFLSPAEKPSKMADDFEPIPIDGQDKIGVWVHHPGSDIFQKWEPRKGKVRGDTELCSEDVETPKSGASGSQCSDSSSSEETKGGKKGSRLGKIKKGFRALSSAFSRSPKVDKQSSDLSEDALPTSRYNIQSVSNKHIGVKFINDRENAVEQKDDQDCDALAGPGDNGCNNSFKSHVHAKDVAKGILKQAGSWKNPLSRKSFNEEKNAEKGMDKSGEGGAGHAYAVSRSDNMSSVSSSEKETTETNNKDGDSAGTVGQIIVPSVITLGHSTATDSPSSLESMDHSCSVSPAVQ